MADITQNIEINSIDLAVTVDTNQLSFTPDGINLNLYPGSTITYPSGSNTQIQYNDNGNFAGTSNLTYSDGITTISNVIVTTSANLGSVSNVKITGGTNGYVLQTDGSGNLSWTVQTGGGGGNGSPGGANTQVQYNNAGNFGGAAGFTFDSTTGNLNIPGNVTALQGLNGSSLTVTGTTSIQQAKEKVTLNATGSTGTINFDILTQAILYKTANASNNFTLNIRGNSVTTLDSIMSNGQSVTCTLINTNGTLGYYANVISIDGNTITPLWPITGAPTSGTASGVDTYTFNIIKTNTNIFTVLAARAGFQ